MNKPSDNSKHFSGFGWRIPLFGKASGRSPLRNRDMNVLVRCVNALGNMTIREAETYAVLYSEGNVVIQIKRGGGGAGGGGGASPPVWL